MDTVLIRYVAGDVADTTVPASAVPYWRTAGWIPVSEIPADEAQQLTPSTDPPWPLNSAASNEGTDDQ
jgi:hypothetical protein